jgi:hypothetical protein
MCRMLKLSNKYYINTKHIIEIEHFDNTFCIVINAYNKDFYLIHHNYSQGSIEYENIKRYLENN